MKIIQPVRLDGYFTITHKRGDKIISQETIHNTSTKDGFQQIAGLINGQATNNFTWIAVDESSTAATADDSSLAVEASDSGLTRASATASKVTTTNPGDTAQLEHTFSASGTITARGAGIFDTSTTNGGTMAARSTFTAKNMESGDTLKITYSMKVS
jgi:hypothetical protein